MCIALGKDRLINRPITSDTNRITRLVPKQFGICAAGPADRKPWTSGMNLNGCNLKIGIAIFRSSMFTKCLGDNCLLVRMYRTVAKVVVALTVDCFIARPSWIGMIYTLPPKRCALNEARLSLFFCSCSRELLFA